MQSPTTPRFQSRPSRREFLKVGAAAAVAGLTTPWFAGCGEGSSPGGEGTWKAMSWENKDEMKKWRLHLGDFFEQNYPKIKWEVDFGLAWEEYWTKLQTVVAGGATLDMCWMHDTRNALFASQGFLEPLDDYIQETTPTGWPDKFYESQVGSFQYQGSQYAIPYDFATGGFYVNLDWLEKAGVDVPTEDWTFDDLLEAGMRLNEVAEDPDKQWGISLPTDSYNSYFIVRSLGGEFVSNDPLEAHFTDSGTVAAYQYLYDAIWKHRLMPNPQQILAATGGTGDVAAFFSSGRVAILYSLNDVAFVMNDLIGDKFRWTVAPTPTGKAGRFQFVGGSGFSIPKVSSEPEISYQAIKYTLTNPKNLPATGKMGSMFVSRKDYWEYGVPPKDELDPAAYKHTFYDLGKRNGTHPLYFPNYGRWDSSVYVKNMDNLWVNKEQDAGKVLRQVQTETEPLLQEPT